MLLLVIVRPAPLLDRYEEIERLQDERDHLLAVLLRIAELFGAVPQDEPAEVTRYHKPGFHRLIAGSRAGPLPG